MVDMIFKKSYLRITDVATIFHDNGFEYDLNDKTQYQDFIETLIDLMQENKITPIFFYDGITTNTDDSDSEFCREYFICDTVSITEYHETHKITIKTEKPYNAYFRLKDRKPRRLTTPFQKQPILYFSKNEVEALFSPNLIKENLVSNIHSETTPQAAQQDLSAIEQNTSDAYIKNLKDKIVQLEASINELSAKPTKSLSTKDNKKSRHQDEKVITFLALLLSQQSNKWLNDKKPNFEQIGKSINDLADNLIDKESQYGLKSSSRIRTAFNNCSDLFTQFQTNEKPKMKVDEL